MIISDLTEVLGPLSPLVFDLVDCHSIAISHFRPPIPCCFGGDIFQEYNTIRDKMGVFFQHVNKHPGIHVYELMI